MSGYEGLDRALDGLIRDAQLVLGVAELAADVARAHADLNIGHRLGTIAQHYVEGGGYSPQPLGEQQPPGRLVRDIQTAMSRAEERERNGEPVDPYTVDPYTGAPPPQAPWPTAAPLPPQPPRYPPQLHPHPHHGNGVRR